MPLARWNPPPLFYDPLKTPLGEVQGTTVLSAEAHVNALVRCAHYLHSLLMTPRAPFMAINGNTESSIEEGPDGFLIYMGAMRHKPSMGTTMTQVAIVRMFPVDGSYPITAVTVKGQGGDAGKVTLAAANFTSKTGYKEARVEKDISNCRDGFWEVFIYTVGGKNAQVEACYEEATISMAELPTFTTGVHSWEDWQALSTRAQLLYDVLSSTIRIPFPSYMYFSQSGSNAGATLRGGSDKEETSNCRGFIVRRGRYLNFALSFVAQSWFQDSARIKILIDGTSKAEYGYTYMKADLVPGASTIDLAGSDFLASKTVATEWGEKMELGTCAFVEDETGGRYRYQIVARNIDTKSPISAEDMATKTRARDSWVRNYAVGERSPDKGSGVDYNRAYMSTSVDLEGVVDFGDLYEVVAAKWQDGLQGDGSSMIRVEFLSEGPSADQEIAGWSTMSLIDKDDAVTEPIVSAIRDNLQALSTAAVSEYRNWAMPNLMAAPSAGRDGDGWFIRGHCRWLIYYKGYDEKDHAEVTLTFTRGKVETGLYRVETVSLEIEPYKWMAFDLETISGLAPGTPYKVHGSTFACEDDDVLGL